MIQCGVIFSVSLSLSLTFSRSHSLFFAFYLRRIIAKRLSDDYRFSHLKKKNYIMREKIIKKKKKKHFTTQQGCSCLRACIYTLRSKCPFNRSVIKLNTYFFLRASLRRVRDTWNERKNSNVRLKILQHRRKWLETENRFFFCPQLIELGR